MDRAVVEQYVNNFLTKYGDYLRMQAKNYRTSRWDDDENPYVYDYKIDLDYPSSVDPDDYCIANTYKRLYIFPRFYSRFVYVVSSKHNYELFEYFILSREASAMEADDAVDFVGDWSDIYLDYNSDSIINGDESKCPLVIFEPMYTKIKFKHDIRDIDIIIANYEIDGTQYEDVTLYNLILVNTGRGKFVTGELTVYLEPIGRENDSSDVDDDEEEDDDF